MKQQIAAFTKRVHDWPAKNWKKTLAGAVFASSMVLVFGLGLTSASKVEAQVTAARTEALVGVCPDLYLGQAPAVLAAYGVAQKSTHEDLVRAYLRDVLKVEATWPQARDCSNAIDERSMKKAEATSK